eukprot:INCI54.1.p1 GENE.INCI54.1~~INCI54.1.p1  ORF type:complete len:107 (-),score=18.65 INCI54.1:89-409(-)
MFLFCPRCATLLLFEHQPDSRFFCKTCPYVYNIPYKMTVDFKQKTKKVEDIMGGAAAWETAKRIAARCPDCAHNMAYYHQLQTRSADEPMTTFYKCIKCSKQWNDD